MDVSISYPRLPLKVWTRHDAADGEWWSNGVWTLKKDSSQMWVLRCPNRIVGRHEYLSNAMRHAAALAQVPPQSEVSAT